MPDSAATHKGYSLVQFAHYLSFYESGTPLLEHFPFLFLEKYFFFILPIHETQINDSFINPEKFGIVISICCFLHAHLYILTLHGNQISVCPIFFSNRSLTFLKI